MPKPTLAKYLDPLVLNQIGGRDFEPRSLVVGNLAGAHKSPLAGFAVEFAGHREYVPGDDPRHIDWRVYYNRDKYFVKQYEMETNLVCHLVLDISASMRYGVETSQKMLYAAKLATTLGYCVLRQRDKVSLTTFDSEVRIALPPSNSMAQISRMVDELDRAEAVRPTRTADCLLELAQRIGRREIVIVLSDFFGDVAEIEPALQRLRYYQHEVVLLQVLHSDELQFRLPDNVKFVGLESGDELTARPADLRKNYLRALRAHQHGLSELAIRNGCEYVSLDTSRDLAESLADYLNQRSLASHGR